MSVTSVAPAGGCHGAGIDLDDLPVPALRLFVLPGTLQRQRVAEGDRGEDRVVLRQFACPGCGLLIENEIAVADEPPLRDVELRMK